MTHTRMSRWTETADARRVCEAAMYDRPTTKPSGHRAHPGSTVARMPSLIFAILANQWRGHAVAG